ncbi:acyltransferase family protein [Spiribacter halobius]|uniref:acyltransferase family protein n=1 Tax=Sediminicurvatus halobius TaxID=2182432 RepID=UPI001304B1F0|nr:acyltransferase family protein [Spiribacter halobius]UEX77331.1 acyltransferase [Spiribacter halobius]
MSEASHAARGSEFRPDIQGLRALAVLLVVAYHAGTPWLPGGYVGVDLFFVISGYVICGVLARELRGHPLANPRLDFVRFYARRMRRLLPAALLVFTVTLAAGWFVSSPLQLQSHATSALAAILYVGNFRFALEATDYLNETSATDPFLHTWSLAVEEQFYLAWPLLIFALFRFAPLRHRMLWVALGMLPAIAVSLALSDYLTAYSGPWGFFSPWTRAWEFGLGALGYCAASMLSGRHPHVASVLAVSGLAAVLMAAVSFGEDTRFPGTAALLPAAGTLALLVSPAIGRGSFVERMFSVWPLRWVGDLSYSWYLWHWPVYVYAAALFGGLNAVTALVCALLSLGLAWVTFRTVENPIRVGRVAPLRASRSVSAGLCLTAAVGVICFGVERIASAELASEDQRQYAHASRDSSPVYEYGCHLGYHETRQPQCLFGAPEGTKTFVLFGDSHAAHWFPALERLANVRGWRLYSWTKSGCPSFEVDTFATHLERPYHECSAWRQAAFQRILELRPDVVILSNASGYLRERGPARVTRDEWESGIENAIGRLAGAGLNVVVLDEVPRPGRDIPECLSRATWFGSETPGDTCAFRADRAASERLTAELVERRGDATLIDTGQLVCPGVRCEVIRDGVVVFQDASHLTATFSRRLARRLGAMLAESVPDLRDPARRQSGDA